MKNIIRQRIKRLCKPYMAKRILDYIGQNSVTNKQGWKSNIKNGINRPWDPVKFRKEANESLMSAGFGYDISLVDGKTKSYLIIKKKGKLIKELHFFNNDGDVIIRRLNGFIGYDFNIILTLLAHPGTLLLANQFADTVRKWKVKQLQRNQEIIKND